MTIKINGQPEQVKMALRRFRETLLISQILKRSNVIDCTIADSL
jgi:hypothetical protein